MTVVAVNCVSQTLCSIVNFNLSELCHTNKVKNHSHIQDVAVCLLRACCMLVCCLLATCLLYACYVCLLRACFVHSAYLLRACCVLAACLHMCLLLHNVYLLCLLHYLNFPPKFGSTGGSPLYAYKSSSSSYLLQNMVEASCCLVSALTNRVCQELKKLHKN